MPNALAQETSPYLLGHQHNPVDWWPWGPEALALARELDRPILVSIGYSACHWCHVMERESFADPAIAAVMNEHLICIKVDREERPDIDAIYMDAIQAMTGQGGWPLNVFVTPDQVPFFGGTYYPPTPRGGMLAWPDVVRAVAQAWETQRDEIEEQGVLIAERLSGGAQLRATGEAVAGERIATDAVQSLTRHYDSVQGGFGGAPKFPPHALLRLLLHRPDGQAMALHTLRSMAWGGIYDQLGGGFARYTVDATWTVPHFEKMLYDNALLLRSYVEAHQITGDPLLARVAAETADWALREMQAPDGGFYAAIDADSEGAEGTFYVWEFDALRDVLGDADAEIAIAWFGVSPQGNFEGRNVLEVRGEEPDSDTRDRIRAALLTTRDQRERPATDDKRLTSWNALMIGALAYSGTILHRPQDLVAAEQTADFLLTQMRDDDGRLLRTYNRGQARLAAYLEDYAYTVEALLTLYECTGQAHWFTEARTLADLMLADFADDEHGGFFSTAIGHEQLVVRRKELEDTPMPAGASSAALALTRLAMFTGEARYEDAAQRALALVASLAAEHPQAFGYALHALDVRARPRREIALVGSNLEPMLAILRERPRPDVVVAIGDGLHDGGVPLLTGRPAQAGAATVYICQQMACQTPILDPQDLRAALDS